MGEVGKCFSTYAKYLHNGHGDHYRQCEHRVLEQNDRQKNLLGPRNRMIDNIKACNSEIKLFHCII